MNIRTEKDVERLVRDDTWMMQVLCAAETMNLPGWWIGAGFLRNKIWDAMEDNPSCTSRDVDLFYFESTDTRAETDWEYDSRMRDMYPFAEWEVRNQARMHYKMGLHHLLQQKMGSHIG